MQNQTIPFIDPEDLFHALFSSTAPTIIDVRIAEDIAAQPFTIPTAQACPHGQVLSAPIAIRTVLCCHKGLKLSIGAAALLRAEGHQAAVLTGGTEAWRLAGLPRIPPKTALNALRFVADPSQIDAKLAYWILKRFFRPDIKILWVPGDTVAAVSQKFDIAVLPRPETCLEQFEGDPPNMDDLVRHAKELPMGRMIRDRDAAGALCLLDSLYLALLPEAAA